MLFNCSLELLETDLLHCSPLLSTDGNKLMPIISVSLAEYTSSVEQVRPSH